MEVEIDSSSASKDSEMSTTSTHICKGCGADFSFLYEKKEKKEKKTGNRKRTHNDDHDCGDNCGTDNDDEKEMDPKLKKLLDEYYDRYKESETELASVLLIYDWGFDVPEPPCLTFLAIRPYHKLEDPLLQEMAKFAVLEQNKSEEQKDQGRMLEFIRIIKSMREAGTLHYITIEVQDVNAGKPVICQAMVARRYGDDGWYNFLRLFRDAPVSS